MTREEAIHFATCLKNNWTINFADMEDFCDMAIEALQNLSKPNNGLQGSDLISRQDAIKPFCIAPDGARIPEVDCDNFPVEFSIEFIKKHLLSLPSADRPTGEWVSNHDGTWNCSECGLRVLVYAKGNYCPNCGAKMESGEE